MTQALQKVSQGDLLESELNIILPARRKIDGDASLSQGKIGCFIEARCQLRNRSVPHAQDASSSRSSVGEGFRGAEKRWTKNRRTGRKRRTGRIR